MLSMNTRPCQQRQLGKTHHGWIVCEERKDLGGQADSKCRSDKMDTWASASTSTTTCTTNPHPHCGHTRYQLAGRRAFLVWDLTRTHLPLDPDPNKSRHRAQPPRPADHALQPPPVDRLPTATLPGALGGDRKETPVSRRAALSPGWAGHGLEAA